MEAYEIILLSVRVSVYLSIWLCIPPVSVRKSYEITLLSLCFPIFFLVFYAVRVVSKEINRLVHPRISCV
jgi:hypothetical protein